MPQEFYTLRVFTIGFFKVRILVTFLTLILGIGWFLLACCVEKGVLGNSPDLA